MNAVLEVLREHKLPEKLIIDCSHDNSPNHEMEQETVFGDVINQVVEGTRAIKGVILESHLQAGKQISDGTTPHPETSITDPCLDWNQTEGLLKEGAKRLQTKRHT